MDFDAFLDKAFLILGFIYLVSAFYILYRFTVQRNAWKIYTILYLISYAFILFFCFYYFSAYPQVAPAVLLFNMPPLFTLTAAAFVATRIIVYPDYHYSAKDLLHFIPAISLAIILLLLFQLSAEEKSVLFAYRTLNIFKQIDFMNFCALLSLLDILFYLSYQIIQIALQLILKKDLFRNKVYKNTMIQLLVIRGLNLGLPTMIYIEIVTGFSLTIIKLTGIFLALNSILLTSFMAIYSVVFKVPRSHDSELTNDDEDAMWLKKIRYLLEKEKPFLNEDFQLENLGTMMGITRNQTSAIINRCFGCTFLELLHEYRLAEAKKILELNDDVKPSLVGFEVGYKSMSVYYNAFHKKTGMSPQEYRNKNYKKN